MSIYYLDEHLACSEYMSDIKLGFKYMEVAQGTVFDVEEKRHKHLFFILEGSVKVRYNEFPNREFTAGEMFFLPKSADCRGEALTKCSFIVHIYDAPVRLCDKVGLNSIVKAAEDVKYEFDSLPICSTLGSFLLLLRTYLQEGMNCHHLHEIKQKELFMIFRTHYSKQDLAQFFFPMLGKSLDFRSKVMAHYPQAKTVRDLAAICHYSEGHFNELFTAEFGEPPYRWMQKQKAKHIIGRLLDPSVPLKEIVYEFDFSSQSHLNRYCKVQFGEPAAKVRRGLMSSDQ